MSGGIAGRGQPGREGPTGPMGPQGPKGPAAFSVDIGQVSAVPYGGAPSVENVGTDQDQIWNIAVPTGATGVLTGPSPPTGADGTSLGQLYFCTANQMYYGLIELSENNNKWRPIMTQESSIRTYYFDIVTAGRSIEGLDMPIGFVAIKMDDVARTLTMSKHIYVDVPVVASSAGGYRLYVDAAEHAALMADCVSCGINSLPFPVSITINGVTTEETWNFMNETGYAPLATLTRALLPGGTGNLKQYQSEAGTGNQPGVRYAFDHGRVVQVVNDTGAPGASTYGDAPGEGAAVHGDDIMVMLYMNPSGDLTYPSTYRASSTEVVPYA